MDNPHELDTVIKPHRGAACGILHSVARRNDLNDQVGHDLCVASAGRARRQALGASEGDIRLAHRVGVALQPDAGVGCDQPAEPLRFDYQEHLADEVGDDPTVLFPRRHRLMQHPPNELAAHALAVEAQ